ncbi:MAG: GNAT family N-acetyltransferase [Opitutales bacterium]|nr:GNAT family N-acetyltransferase [Opitutales bacterium]
MSAGPVCVRQATADDGSAIARFNIDLAAETEGIRLDPATVARGVQSVFDKPERGLYFLAELDGTAAGCLLVTTEWSDWRNADFWWIQSVFVDRPHRRKGVFRALLQTLREVASARADVCGLRLYVHASNERAHAVYRECGFRETGYHILETPGGRTGA